MFLFEEKENYDINDLLKIVTLLRDPQNGCPWDIAQTHESIRKNFIEETYEAVEAIDLRDEVLLQEELGDVLLQIVLHAQMETENEVFSFSDVCDSICKKLILRHPHIFSDIEANTTAEVLQNWENIKQKEKKQETIADKLMAVPISLPALMRTQKVQKRAGIIYEGLEEEVNTLYLLKQKIEDIEKTINYSDDALLLVKDNIGDVLFLTAKLAQSFEIDAEEVLSQKIDDFIKQF